MHTQENMGAVRKMVGETWRDALMRVADVVGKAWEASHIFDSYVTRGHSARQAAAMTVHDYNSRELLLA